MKRLPYREGDWFAVPLAGGGYGAGLIARSPKRGRILLGYFFGPRRSTLPKFSDLLRLTPGEALAVELFGDLALIEGEWSVLGSTPDWNRSLWPMPVFGSVEGNTGYRVEYPNEDLAAEPRLTRISAAEASRLPEERLQGAEAMALLLDELLG
jgi:hypothetical protein